MVVSTLEAFTLPSGLPVASGFSLTGEPLTGEDLPVSSRQSGDSGTTSSSMASLLRINFPRFFCFFEIRLAISLAHLFFEAGDTGVGISRITTPLLLS